MIATGSVYKWLNLPRGKPIALQDALEDIDISCKMQGVHGLSNEEILKIFDDLVAMGGLVDFHNGLVAWAENGNTGIDDIDSAVKAAKAHTTPYESYLPTKGITSRVIAAINNLPVRTYRKGELIKLLFSMMDDNENPCQIIYAVEQCHRKECYSKQIYSGTINGKTWIWGPKKYTG